MTGARRRAAAQIRLGGMSVDPAIQFPGESREYRLARNQLLEAEIELRRTIERVAAQRRALPPGGAVPDDYVLTSVSRPGANNCENVTSPPSPTASSKT